MKPQQTYDSDPQRSYGRRQRACLIVACIGIVIAATSSSMAVSQIKERTSARIDLAELASARYGLLNPDSWVEQLVPILSAKIEVFDLKNVDQQSLQMSIQGILDRLIEDVKQTIRARNLSGQGLFNNVVGQAKQLVLETLVDFEEIHRQVPEYAKGVVAGLGTPEAKDLLRQYLKQLLTTAAGNSGGSADRRAYTVILNQNHCDTGVLCQELLTARLAQADKTIRIAYIVALLTSTLVFVAIFTGGLSHTKSGAMLLVGCSAVLLVSALLAPMIEIEAKLSQVSLRLLGEPIVFNNQVLYFKTKSIWDVVVLLFSEGEFWKSFVGGLVFLFSVVFPTGKLVASIVHTYDLGGLRGNCVTQFLALRSSKWSMADVLVVAIFMAYIGFDSMVKNSLDQLQVVGSGVDIVSTNGTSLQPGYYLFIGFCIASLFLSAALDRVEHDRRSSGQEVKGESSVEQASR